MSPLMIIMLMDYYSKANGYEGEIHDPQEQAIAYFLEQDLIRKDDLQPHEPHPTSYSTTERGNFYVEHLCDIPLPVSSWSIPMDNITNT